MGHNIEDCSFEESEWFYKTDPITWIVFRGKETDGKLKVICDI